MKKLPFCLLPFCLLTLTLLAGPAYADRAKIDPRFYPLLDGAEKQEPAGSVHKWMIKRHKNNTIEYLGCIVRFNGTLDTLKALGGVVRSVIGDIATVEIPLLLLDEASNLPEIIYIEAPRRLKRKLNNSIPEINADKLRTGTAGGFTGSTGRGVIIGTVDSGIDFNHPDFKDSSGNTRLLYLWDQSLFGTPPAGRSYGHECTAAMINAKNCLSRDTDGHGTHVAGIAAGNGAGNLNSLADIYTGVAPEADLVIVSYEPDAVPANDITTDALLDGIAYIQEKAGSLGKPSVINLSLGSHMSPHDGSSLYERGLDNASGAGKIIVGAAGNEATAQLHASGTIKTGESKDILFFIPQETRSVQMGIWYPGSDRIGFSIHNNTQKCDSDEAITNSSATKETPCGQIIIAAGSPAANGDIGVMIDITATAGSTITSGSWQLTVRGDAVVNGRFDAWSGEQDGETYFQTDIDSTITLVDTATASKVIAVTAYNTKDSWESKTGIISPNNDTDPGNNIILDDIASFSSAGPVRKCSITTNCTTSRKPDIAAPGSMITSALSNNMTETDNAKTDPSNIYLVLQGTSMSTPHVTGAVALLLQVNPRLTPAEAAAALNDNTAPADNFTGSLPNNRWGNGKLDINAAFKSVPNRSPPAISGFTAASQSGAVLLSWSRSGELDIESYNIYRSPDNITFTLLASLSHSANSYLDDGLASGTTYNYRLKAVDTVGQEGDAANKSATVANSNTNVNTDSNSNSNDSNTNNDSNNAGNDSNTNDNSNNTAAPPLQAVGGGCFITQILANAW